MPLFIVATPIGHPQDLTLRARELLQACPIVIGEERPETERFLKRNGRYPFLRIELLNEHSTPADVKALAALCRDHEVALISDCGTPGWCDPGAELTAACRAQGIAVKPLPGASSLMSLLSVVGTRFNEFHFGGFPPRDENERRAWIQKMCTRNEAVVMMDTPYRLSKFLTELAALIPDRRALIGFDLTLATERIEEDVVRRLNAKFPPGVKGEFILCLYPLSAGRSQGGGSHANKM